MPTTEEKPSDDVEKVLSDLKSIEDPMQALIDDLLRQKDDAMKAFDDKLLKLGWKPDSTGKPKKATIKGRPRARRRNRRRRPRLLQGPFPLHRRRSGRPDAVL